MEPTDEERNLIIDASSLFVWAGLSAQTPQIVPAVGEDGRPLVEQPPPPVSPLVSLLAWFDAAPTTHYRIFAMMTPSDFAQALETSWAVNGKKPSLMMMTAAKLAQVTARRLCKLEPWPAEAAAAAANSAMNVAAAVGPLAAQCAPTPAGDMVQLDKVLNQGAGGTIDYISDLDHQKLYAQYMKEVGRMPKEDEDPTLEQVSALCHTIKAKRLPYADFSVFGEHGTRIMRKIKLVGLTLDASGKLVTMEITGPPTFEAWENCYRVLCTALNMLNDVSRNSLDDYATTMKDFHQLHGSEVWHILYQADVRMRSERMVRIKMDVIHEHEKAVNAGRSSSFDASRPWDSVWQAAVQDSKFWKKEFETPAFLVVTRVASLTSMVQGDAPVQAMAPGHSCTSSGLQTSVISPPTPLATAGTGKRHGTFGVDKPAKSLNIGGQHRLAADGSFAVNRKGVMLCEGFQTGTCTAKIRGTEKCAADPSKVHQCSKCLSTAHGSQHPQLCSKTPAPPPPGGSVRMTHLIYRRRRRPAGNPTLMSLRPF